MRRHDLVPRPVLHAPYRVRRRKIATILPLGPLDETAPYALVRRVRARLAGYLHVGRVRLLLQVVEERLSVRQREREPFIRSRVEPEMVAQMVVYLVQFRILER